MTKKDLRSSLTDLETLIELNNLEKQKNHIRK